MDEGSSPSGVSMNLWQSIIANFVGGFLALLAIMVVKLIITGEVL